MSRECGARWQLVLVSLAAACILLAPPPEPSPAADPGTLVITKQVTKGQGPDAGIFAFSGSWGEDFTLTAGQSRSTVLPEGLYSFSEKPEPGYRFLGIDCSSPTGTSEFLGPSASVQVTPGQTSSCTSTSDPVIDIDVDPDATGSARLRTSRSCSRPERLVIRVLAGNAEWVSFRVGYRWVKTVRNPVSGNTFRMVARVGRGAVPVSARVRFVPGASPQESRLAKKVGSCLRSPAFAGGGQ